VKYTKIILLSIVVTALVFSFAFAASKGDVDRGKALFNDPRAFGATGETSCNTCHPDGKGLEKATMKGKKVWTNPAGKWLSLEDANNVCIILANKGKTLDPKSREMMDLNAYIKALGMKKPGKTMKP
jgi:cytochrome c peroxidase